MVKVIVIRLAVKGQYGILFHTECTGEVLPLPTVSLSRSKGKCLFVIDKLQEHDGHTPWHTDKVLANSYCERVVGDIKQELSAKGISFDIVYTEGQLQEANPSETMQAAFAAGQAAWKPGGKLEKIPIDNMLSKLVVAKTAFTMPIGTPFIPN